MHLSCPLHSLNDVSSAVDAMYTVYITVAIEMLLHSG